MPKPSVVTECLTWQPVLKQQEPGLAHAQEVRIRQGCLTQAGRSWQTDVLAEVRVPGGLVMPTAHVTSWLGDVNSPRDFTWSPLRVPVSQTLLRTPVMLG